MQPRDPTPLRRGPHALTLAYTGVAVLHLVAWGMILGASLGAGPMSRSQLLAAGVTAYALGLRHAFDPDHIAAIDSTARVLHHQGRPSWTVGLWFALGHSTVVVALAVALAMGAHALVDSLGDSRSPLQEVARVWGPLVSSVFLLAISAVSIALLWSGGSGDRGVVWRIVTAGRVIDRPSRMYAVGLLFGLGFDTATEIGLLALAAVATVSGSSGGAVFALPLLFAAGMTLLDLSQGAVARRVYTLGPPARRTGASTSTVLLVAISGLVSLVVACVQIARLARDDGLPTGPVQWVAGIDIGGLGIVMTALLVAVALATLWVRRRRRPRET